MHEAVIQNTERRIQRTMEALRANNMEAYYVKAAAEVRPFVEQMIPEGAVVSNGGSVSLAETGVMDLLASGRYQYLDRSKGTIQRYREKCLMRDVAVAFLSGN